MKTRNQPTKAQTGMFGQTLVSKGLITQQQLEDALLEQEIGGGRLGSVLVQMGLLTNSQLASSLADYLHIKYIKLDDMSKIDMQVARMIPENIANKFCLVAIGKDRDDFVVVIADPLNIIAVDTVKFRLENHVKLAVSSSEEICNAMEAIYHGSDVEEQKLRDIVELEVETKHVEHQQNDELQLSFDDESNDEAAFKAPVVKFVDLLLSQAVKSRASDIHIEPQEQSMIIRMRVDGVLRNMVPPSENMMAAVATRIKIISQMNIAERRLPQDGRFKVKAIGRDIDVRVSLIPVIYGEKIVMRILDADAVDHDIDHVGLEGSELERFKGILSQPHGIIIVTGPTGSGKSTTLYSALNHLKDATKNITTVEDPVEYRLEGINQVQIKSDIGLDFAASLRAILRQDPDIILIGEIRDKETVDIAIKASLTGHLVLSTFHTNDAPSAISRLVYMGVEPYLLASSLNLIVAQRLLRRICPKCKEPVELEPQILRQLNISEEVAESAVFYHGKGCANCNRTGYKGRIAVFEFLPIDAPIKEQLLKEHTEVEIKKIARQTGYKTLTENAVEKMFKGLTTAEELLRVTFTEKNG